METKTPQELAEIKSLERIIKRHEDLKAEIMAKYGPNGSKAQNDIQIDTLMYDETVRKNKVQVKCSETGELFWSYTSDLFQTRGLSPKVREAARKAAKKDKKAVMKQNVEEARARLAELQANG